MKIIANKINDLTEKEINMANDYINMALNSNDSEKELIKVVYQMRDIIIKDKIKLEIINHTISEQYYK